MVDEIRHGPGTFFSPFLWFGCCDAVNDSTVHHEYTSILGIEYSSLTLILVSQALCCRF